MKEIKIRTIMVVYLVLTMALIWGLAYLKIEWSSVEVDIHLDDGGNYIFMDKDGRSYAPLEVHLDSRYNTIRWAFLNSWIIMTILTAILIWIKIDREMEIALKR